MFIKNVFSAKRTCFPEKYGFSLVELSVVLAIIGITLGAALTLATNQTESGRIQLTNSRMDAIEEGVAAFLLENSRLPCPANGVLSPSHVDHGRENIDDNDNPSVCDNSLHVSNVDAGVVPTKTLGLPDEFMEDGWGWRFTYVIDDRYANSNSYHPNTVGRNEDCDNITSSDCFTYFDPNVVTIVINDQALGTPSQLTDQAAMVLISHGKNGHGAYLRHGSVTRMTAGFSYGGVENDSAEEENGSFTRAFDNVFVQKAVEGVFDDIVRYKLKWQLAASAGGVNDSAVCAAAENVLDDEDDIICTGSAGTICVDMATILYQRCLEQE
jgi:prepilin-type N-terminal cleavage/methylation domain-containing protein